MLTEQGSTVLKGPYLISSMPSPGRYKLCNEDGTIVENGKLFNESELDFS
jgi:hypothetical protein